MTQNNYTFRKAVEKDASEILKLYRAAIGTEGCTWSESYPNKEICIEDISRGDLFCLINASGETIAAISIDSDEKVDSLKCWNHSIGKMAELSRLVVKEQYQNKGLAPALINEVINVLLQRGYKTVHYLVSKGNIKALASYEKLNFTKVGESNLFGESWHCYEKILDKDIIDIQSLQNGGLE